MSTVRTRFAPSPTGYLHIGGVRTALFNWLFARRHQGQFILRIDDTDQQRNLEEALAPILRGFRWLGLDWDEGPEIGGPHAPYFQSQRGARYQQAVQQLIEAGAAYVDYATTEELQAERTEAEREKRPFLYSRRFMARSEADHRRWEAEGRQPVVRLRMPREGSLTINDAVRGKVTFDWAREQDQVIQRADGTCLYHLASVIDDYDLQITHVIRAEEHLSNTPRQVFIFQALGYPLPQFAHIPFVAEPGSKTKLSKRKLDKYLKHRDFKTLYDLGRQVVQHFGSEVSSETFNPVIVDFYQQIGFLPDALVNYLLLLGWSLDDKTEEFSREKMIECFCLERVNKAPASFDPQKLLAFQDRYMQRWPIKQKVAAMLPFLQRAGYVPTPPPCEVGNYLRTIVEAAGDRIKFAGGVLEYADFFCDDDRLPIDEGALRQRLVESPGARQLLEDCRLFVDEIEPFDAPTLERSLTEWLAQRGVRMKDLVHPLRLAVTGKTVGFGLFDTLAILGKERCRRRIDRVLTLVRGYPAAASCGAESEP